MDHLLLAFHKNTEYARGRGKSSFMLVQNVRLLPEGARLSLNGCSHHRFSQDSLAFSAILRVNGIRRSMAKTIVTIAI